MSDPTDRYVLYGGQAGYDRLLVLSRERWPDTEALLQRAGLHAGMSCFDLGCGGGEVTLEIARWVGPSGSVVGLDMDAKKLDLARKSAAERGLTNVEFRVGTVADWAETDAYDLVYSRFVLQHLRDPARALQKLWAATRAPGTLVVEDADHSTWALHPPDPGFDFFHKMMLSAQVHAGGDPETGRKLLHLALAAGIPRPEIALRSTLRVEGEALSLPLLTLDAVAESLRRDRLATDAEIATARESLARALAKPGTLLVGPNIFQLIGRKGSATR